MPILVCLLVVLLNFIRYPLKETTLPIEFPCRIIIFLFNFSSLPVSFSHKYILYPKRNWFLSKPLIFYLLITLLFQVI